MQGDPVDQFLDRVAGQVGVGQLHRGQGWGHVGGDRLVVKADHRQVADARRWRDDLLDGRAATIEEITTREGLAKGAVSRILPLAWLAPDVAAAILEGRQPAVLTPARLRALPDLPLGWVDQRALLGFPAI